MAPYFSLERNLQGVKGVNHAASYGAENNSQHQKKAACSEKVLRKIAFLPQKAFFCAAKALTYCTLFQNTAPKRQVLREKKYTNPARYPK